MIGRIARISLCAACAVSSSLLPGCMLLVANTGADRDQDTSWQAPDDDDVTPPQGGLRLSSMFPYEHADNWWRYTASNGNQLEITVTATITDGPDTYYKVAFAEQQIDTTEDWFRSTGGGLEFSASLQGTYRLFLPSPITSGSGSFTSGSSTVDYEYYSTAVLGGAAYRRVVRCDYSSSLLHGFDTSYFADSTGIVSLIDEGGRFPVEYLLDSCSIDGELIRF